MISIARPDGPHRRGAYGIAKLECRNDVFVADKLSKSSVEQVLDSVDIKTSDSVIADTRKTDLIDLSDMTQESPMKVVSRPLANKPCPAGAPVFISGNNSLKSIASQSIESVLKADII